MAVNNIEIKVGQKWKTYMGRVVTIDRMTEKGFLVIDEAGSTYEVNERGQSDGTAFLAIDLDSLVAESEFFDFGQWLSEGPVETFTLGGNKVFANTEEVMLHIAEHGSEPGRVFLVGREVQPGEADPDPLAGMQVRFAGDTDAPDADQLASETLSALGWTFDGQCWVQPSDLPTSDDIAAHPLYAVFMKAIEQAMYGKGERHGGARTPFLDQPWVHYVKMHGRGFATGQAAKKLEEAASTRSGEAFETEVLGALVYSGMAILKERGVV